MANDENTAVNDLIARVVNRQTARPVTQTSPHPVMGQETLPASPRALANGSAATPLGAEELRTTIPRSAQDAAPFDSVDPDEIAWRSRRREDSGEHLVGTMRVSQPPDAKQVLRRLALPGALVVGVLAGAYIAIGSESRGAPTAAPVAATPLPPTATPLPSTATPLPPTASPQPTAASPQPTAASPQPTAARGAPALIDVRIDSVPSGATVTLVDRGKTQLVGNTPIAAAIDPSRDYDLMLAYAGRPTKLEHLDPRITQRIVVTLDDAAPAAAPPPPSRPTEPAPRRAPASRRAEPARGDGTLMISSKPPCEIVIDGRPTGLTTPQRAIALSAGRHKVTLINRDKDIKRTLSVQIAPNATEKVIEDLMR